MSRLDIEDILDRYVNGEASGEEIDRIEAWLAQYQSPHAEWQQMDKTTREQWLAGLFDETKTSAGINDQKIIRMQPRKILWRSIAAAAAVLLLFFIAHHEWPAMQNRQVTDQLTLLKVSAKQQKRIILADGSRIWINSNSELNYPKVFNGKTREVYLSGEAYFDIQHDASKPFIIHTGNVITTVLGTAFNIKADNLLHTVIVTVTRGRVSVANGNHTLGVITPNQQISFNEVSNQETQKSVEAEKVIAWQQNYIHFNDITFADAVSQLQKRFKVKISFANEKIKNCRFTGAALKEEKLENILKVICTFNDATYKINADGSIIIDGPGCD